MGKTTSTSSTTTDVRTTQKFKALAAYFGSEDAAIQRWNTLNPNEQIDAKGKVQLPKAVQDLVDAGFTVEEAQAVVVEAPAEVTAKDAADALVEKRGLIHVRGRVYVNPTMIETAVRVLKTGKPEIVDVAGAHRTKAVLIFRTEDEASVALQNLGEPSA